MSTYLDVCLCIMSYRRSDTETVANPLCTGLALNVYTTQNAIYHHSLATAAYTDMDQEKRYRQHSQCACHTTTVLFELRNQWVPMDAAFRDLQ